jgi:hypothetical protein
LRFVRLRNTSFISRAIRLTEAAYRPRASDISDASAPRLASLANRCFSESVHCFGRAVCFVGFRVGPPQLADSFIVAITTDLHSQTVAACRYRSGRAPAGLCPPAGFFTRYSRGKLWEQGPRLCRSYQPTVKEFRRARRAPPQLAASFIVVTAALAPIRSGLPLPGLPRFNGPCPNSPAAANH